MNDKKKMKKIRLMADFMKALSHPSRLLMLKEMKHGERCVCELRDVVGSDISTISKHLSVMKSARLVQEDKRGQWVYYSICCPGLIDYLKSLEEIIKGK
ncbi:MAG: ArsR/SmtB family transcription factor [Victivallaceae bacterium]